MKIIAECGCNWGNFEAAKEMIKNLRMINCDFAKFQLFSKEYARVNGIEPYLSVQMGEMKELVKYGINIGQKVFFTPFDEERVSWIGQYEIPAIKTRFRDRFNAELIKSIIYLADEYKFIWFISIDEDPEIYKRKLISVMNSKGIPISLSDIPRFEPLFCIPEYPADPRKYMFHKMFSLKRLSDHTNNSQLLRLAKQLDFHIVEKHVMLNEDCLERNWSILISELGEVIK